MRTKNRVELIGFLGADPEVRHTDAGDIVANFRIATSDVWTDKKSGERRQKTEWHRITVWGKNAENCGKYLKKGSYVQVEGKLETRKYTDREGVERYVTQINARDVGFLDRPSSRQGATEQAAETELPVEELDALTQSAGASA